MSETGPAFKWKVENGCKPTGRAERPLKPSAAKPKVQPLMDTNKTRATDAATKGERDGLSFEDEEGTEISSLSLYMARQGEVRFPQFGGHDPNAK